MNEEVLICIFCGKTSANLYEINGNSILICNEVVDIDNILLELFMQKTDPNEISFLCEECKDQIVQFYVFKKNAKHVLQRSPLIDIVDELIDFTNSHANKEFEVNSDDNEFKVSLKLEEMKHEGTDDEMAYMVYEYDNAILPIEEEKEHDDEGYDFITEEVFEEEEEDEDMIKEITFKPDHESSMSVTCECGEVFKSIKELKQHALSDHKKKTSQVARKSLLCEVDYCKIMLKDTRFVDLHKKAHESFEAIIPYLPQFQCVDCQIYYSNEIDLHSHNEHHQNGTWDEKKMELIERQSVFDDHIVNHSQIDNSEKSSGESTVICGHCGVNKPEMAMKTHLLFMHSTTIFCPLDNRCFEGKKQFRVFVEHIKNKHPGIFVKKVEYACSYCKKKFPSTFENLAHMKKCDAKKFICESHCGKRFKSEWHLKHHLRFIKNGDTRFKCNLCTKTCVSRSDLQIHMRSHTGERPYECSICGKKFKTSANRSSHMEIHLDKKIHECSICFEKFQTRPIMRKHKKKHDSDYQDQCVCKICFKTYVNRNHLLRHIKTLHSQPDLSIDQIESFFETNGCNDAHQKATEAVIEESFAK